ncbi:MULTISPECIES: hypothetical protein [Chelativorans]|jgi:hypothetical protein|uniref:N,N-dimethylformamidase alpha subunit domain-containing protein n=1 Tax=Chelativorans sp. (strain BNC1) TaxID=266779 RepID=Q11MX8_CHESB|nr:MULTISPECIES: hypothetical protein [Chelativorans]
MGRYQLSANDLQFAREFLASPIGYHSPGLQRVLNRMRGADWAFKYVLVVERRHARWRLGRMPLKRGSAIEMVEDVVYTDLLEAERDIFRRRWKDLTARPLDLGSDDAA